MMSNRTIIAAVLLAAGCALAAWLWRAAAEGEPTPVHIGILHPSNVDVPTAQGFRAGLGALGYVENRDVVYHYDGPSGTGKALNAAAKQLLDDGVDAVFVSSTPATQAIMRASAATGTPIVFGPVNDPIGAGVVASLRQPGGNVTGVRPPPVGGKRMQLLKTIVPSVSRVLVPYRPGDKSSLASLEQAREGAESVGIELVPVEIAREADIAAMLATLPASVDALFLPRDAMINSRIDEIVAAAIHHRLPLSAPAYAQVKAGALFSYGMVHTQIGRHAAKLMDQVLRGADPGQLPVESSFAFLFVNLVTARAIGVDVPDATLAQAEDVIR